VDGRSSTGNPLNHRAVNFPANFDGDTFRAVYTVKIRDEICVLHCFQKKSSSGTATSKKDLDTIKERLAQAMKERGK